MVNLKHGRNGQMLGLKMSKNIFKNLNLTEINLFKLNKHSQLFTILHFNGD
jgi:hypothetical protein